MPPRGVKSAKRKRQYEHIKRSETARGRSNKVAERIAAATTNKTRRQKGETKGSRKRTSSRLARFTHAEGLPQGAPPCARLDRLIGPGTSASWRAAAARG